MHRWAILLVLSPFFVNPLARAAEMPPGKDQGEARVLRFPTLHGKQLVFTWAGDLYTVSSSGGIARRLTSHEGYEMFARFSPDGKHIAFTGQYDGNTEIYVIPSEGGVPRRLTWTATLGRDDVSDRMGPNNIVLGWTPDGKHVLFRSRMRSFNDFIGQIYKVPLEGGLPEPLPLPRGGFCSFSPDGTKLAYNRVFREFRTWKRYRGGMADDVWIHDFETKKTTNITNHSTQDIHPMWHGENIFFLSDRGDDKRMNLHVTDPQGRKVRQLTHFKDFDIKFPSLGDSAVVFEQAGYLWKFDLASEKCEKLTIRILEDNALARSKLQSVGQEVTSFEINHDGTRALFGAHGEVFTVPAKTGITHNLTNTPGVHERNAKWSPDGKLIAWVADASGEDEIYTTSPDGKGEPTRLTKGGDTYKYELAWSPDSKKILWGDKKLRLSYVDVNTKETRLVTQAKIWEIRDAVWSPDSRWISWSQQEANDLSQVYLYSLEQGRKFRVTEGRFNSGGPAFSGDGKYLFFVSRRDFDPIYSQTEWNHAYQDMARIYLATLAKDTPSPFRPLGDEEAEKKPDEKKGDEKKPAEKAADKPLKIDPDGIEDRILQLPVTPANYRSLQSVGSSLYYIRQGSKDTKPAFFVYDLSTRKETALGSVTGYEISGDGKKMLVSQDRRYGIIDLPKGPVTVSEPLDLSGMEMQLDRQQEWKQIFHECWRQMRDFFYDPGLHGVDWKAVRDRYEPLVAHVGHRADLTYVLGEMISELNVGHAYVGGGDMPKPRRLPLGLLGAELRKDPKSGYFQIVRILKGSRWDPELRSPLREPGAEAKEGEYILAIDGRSTKEMPNLYEALVNKAGKQVALRVHGTPEQTGSRTLTVVPIASEASLYYHDQVERNLQRVSDATGGEVGYLHVPDMLATGLNQFNRYFYPQVRKKALIIDVRGNGGGNVSPMLIERLRREAAMITIARNSSPRTDPAAMIYGPLVCLMNEFSASDGDLFPYRFRQHHLGKLIGKRSWGGVVGIRGTLPLLDGGYLNRPEFSRYDLEGKEWVIEGYGVDPDIVVDNDPAREYAGTDDQLERAIQEILADLKKKGHSIPPPPVSPKR
jgi:tricorn protease